MCKIINITERWNLNKNKTKLIIILYINYIYHCHNLYVGTRVYNVGKYILAKKYFLYLYFLQYNYYRQKKKLSEYLYILCTEL